MEYYELHLEWNTMFKKILQIALSHKYLSLKRDHYIGDVAERSIVSE